MKLATNAVLVVLPAMFLALSAFALSTTICGWYGGQATFDAANQALLSANTDVGRSLTESGAGQIDGLFVAATKRLRVLVRSTNLLASDGRPLPVLAGLSSVTPAVDPSGMPLYMAGFKLGSPVILQQPYANSTANAAILFRPALVSGPFVQLYVGYNDGSIYWMTPVWSSADDYATGWFPRCGGGSAPGYRPQCDRWYLNAMNLTNSDVAYSLYFDADAKSISATISSVLPNGGVIGADMNLQILQQAMQRKVTASGFSALIAFDGTVVLHPAVDPSLPAVRKITEVEPGFPGQLLRQLNAEPIEYERSGNSWFVACAGAPIPKLALCLFWPTTERTAVSDHLYLAGRSDLVTSIIVCCVVGVFILLVIGWAASDFGSMLAAWIDNRTTVLGRMADAAADGKRLAADDLNIRRTAAAASTNRLNIIDLPAIDDDGGPNTAPALELNRLAADVSDLATAHQFNIAVDSAGKHNRYPEQELAVVQACLAVWIRTKNRRAAAIGMLTLADLRYRTAMQIDTKTEADRQNRDAWLRLAVDAVQDCGRMLVVDGSASVPASASPKIRPDDEKSPGHRLRTDAMVGIKADALHNLGVYRTEQRLFDDARRSFDAAADLYRTMPTTAGFSMTCISMAAMFRSRGIGHTEDAENALNCAIEFAANNDDKTAPHHARPILERAILRSEVYRDYGTAATLCRQILNDFPRLDPAVAAAAEAVLSAERKSDNNGDEKQPAVRNRRILFVVDRSGSMSENGKMETCKSCISAFLDDHTAPTTDIGLISFSHTIRTDVAMQTRGPAISDTLTAIKRMVGNLQPDGGTALFGAVQAGFNEMLSVIKRTGAGTDDHIFVITDGNSGEQAVPGSNDNRPPDLIRLMDLVPPLVGIDLAFYAVGDVSAATKGILQNLVDRHGGRVVSVGNGGTGVQDAFQDIGRRFAAQTAVRTA